MGVCRPASAGKDSTTGHWELCGADPGPAVPDLSRRIPGRGHRGVQPPDRARRARQPGRVGHRDSRRAGAEHVATGDWIVYTSADSVFQVAAHEEMVPLAELYAACTMARALLHGPARRRPGDRAAVRGRPRALEADRASKGPEPPAARARRCSIAWPTATSRVVGVGKVDDLFAGRNITSTHTPTNPEAYRLIDAALAVAEARVPVRQRDRIRSDLGAPQRCPGFPSRACWSSIGSLPGWLAPAAGR